MKRIANYLIAMAIMAFTFTSCEDVPSPFGEIVKPSSGDVIKVDPTGTGTEADPYNVAAVLEYLSGLGADVQSPNEVFIKGIISEVSDIDVSGTYGNATYYISDDADGKANKFYIYRGFGLGGKKFNEGATAIKVGDNVTIKSKVVNYKGNTPETVANNCIIVELNGAKDSGGDTPTPTSDLGTKDAPITVAKALETINKLADGGETGEAYVKGIISKVQSYNSQYKSITYYISDDGKEANELQVYSGKGLNGAEFSAKEDLAAGDVVVVKGTLKKYVMNGTVTPEINQSSEIVSLTKGSGGGGSDTPSGTASGTGTKADPFNIAAAIAKCKEIGQTASTEKYYVKGIVVKGGTASGGYGNVTFTMGDTKDDAEVFTAYQVAGSDGESLADGYTVDAGAEVIVYGPIYNYMGNTPETSGKSSAQIVTINGKKTNESGDNTGGGGTSAEGDITAVFGDLDCSNIASIKLSDGTTLSVSQEDGKSAPIYHESTKIIRIYAHNAITINAGSKKISKIVFSYDTYNGTAYSGNDEMYGEVGSSKLSPAKDDKTVTFTNINNSTIKVVNWLDSGNSGGTQFRITQIAITYAK